MPSSKIDNDWAATKPVTPTTTGLRFALTTASAAATVAAASTYALRLNAAASGPAWFECDGTATLPADVTSGTGFFLDAGQEVVLRTVAATQLSGIMTTGTGTALLTRLDV
jgi:hypothetical protein